MWHSRPGCDPGSHSRGRLCHKVLEITLILAFSRSTGRRDQRPLAANGSCSCRAGPEKTRQF